jgi:hypothetical protein
MNRLYAERGNGEHQHLFVYPTPPVAYYYWPFRHQVDWNIENFLPSIVTWARSWLAVHDSRRYDILLTTYSELARDEPGYIHTTPALMRFSRSIRGFVHDRTLSEDQQDTHPNLTFSQ